MAQVFVPFPAAPALARIPLLPLTCPADAGRAGEPVHPLVREGMFLASRQASALAAATSPEGRAGSTVRSYTLRARTRPTPQGVFAGVAAAAFSDSGPHSWTMGSAHRARSIPDSGWLAAVADRVLTDLDVLPRLTLSSNNLAVRRGGRLEHERPAEPGTTGVRRVTVRATDAALLIMKVCARGATGGEVLDAVTRAWPGAPQASVRGMILQLVRHGFLLTDLIPDSGSGDPLGHLLGKLPSDSALREDLTLIRRHLADADTHPPGAPQRLTMLDTARDVADRVSRQERPVRVDVAVDAQLVLPARLAREAAHAAGVLWRIGSGPDPLAGFHDRFTNRYGQHRFVPLLDALDPVIGISTDMTETKPEPAQEPTTVLATLIASATAEHGIEVELDAATVEALATANGSEAALPPRTAEIYVQVFADSPDDAA
ncbi:lantibiotic dehydratase, partial [Nonomuraea sp. NPDC049784]|uniref:lantibiotic dehydratase n=1 Tax=Nonomuraea sp. NPDC049784 TaxID=3154361 RepID=UPI0033CD5019